MASLHSRDWFAYSVCQAYPDVLKPGHWPIGTELTRQWCIKLGCSSLPVLLIATKVPHSPAHWARDFLPWTELPGKLFLGRGVASPVWSRVGDQCSDLAECCGRWDISGQMMRNQLKMTSKDWLYLLLWPGSQRVMSQLDSEIPTVSSKLCSLPKGIAGVSSCWWGGTPLQPPALGQLWGLTSRP